MPESLMPGESPISRLEALSCVRSVAEPSILMEVASEDGHRLSYLEIFGKLFDGARVHNLVEMLLARQPLFFLTIEGSFARYSLVAPARAMLGRRTAALLLRPAPALTGTTVRLRLKRTILNLLRRLRHVQTLTILPFSVEPRFAEVADGAIYDPQLWDLGPRERQYVERADGALTAAIRTAAAGRPVCCAIGYQSTAKGFGCFSDLYVQNSSLRASMLFAFGGTVSPSVEEHVGAFEQAGGFSVNRYVTDSEVLDLYAAADFVWCVYDRDYDQASGVLGRAAQLGIPALVRRHSLVHRMCELEDISHFAVDETTDWRLIVEAGRRRNVLQGLTRAQRMREASLRQLALALGVDE